jgi:hypothetical protein
MVIRWGLVAGANFQRAAGSYVNFEAVGSSNQYNFMQTASTPNNVFELFDVSLTEGASAPPFVLPDYGSELLACQRCYQVLDSVAFYTVSANFDYQNYTYLTTMRSSPVIIPAPTGPGMLDMTFQGSVNACFMLSPGASQTVSGGALKLDARM